jgi:hypothetical protein
MLINANRRRSSGMVSASASRDGGQPLANLPGNLIRTLQTGQLKASTSFYDSVACAHLDHQIGQAFGSERLKVLGVQGFLEVIAPTVPPSAVAAPGVFEHPNIRSKNALFCAVHHIRGQVHVHIFFESPRSPKR